MNEQLKSLMEADQALSRNRAIDGSHYERAQAAVRLALEIACPHEYGTRGGICEVCGSEV